MIFHPTILALLLGSVVVSGMLIHAAWQGGRILRKWDIRSGSELQLNLERRTYLVSTVIDYAFGFQIVSLFLFIYTVDGLSALFVGAMCAAGSLNVNEWGYPAIVLKILNSILAGLWLIVNYTDNKAFDYPLIRVKYGLLIFITPFLISEAVVQGQYFFHLKPDIIVSCCGALFSAGSEGMMAGIVSLPFLPVAVVFFSAMAGAFLLGVYSHATGRFAGAFSLMALLVFLAGVTALIAFVSLYFYELPTHHCPFCVLQRETFFVGYPIYINLLSGVISGLGVGLIHLFRNIESLADTIPRIQRRLILVSLLSYGLYLAIVLYAMVFSNLSLTGY